MVTVQYELCWRVLFVGAHSPFNRRFKMRTLRELPRRVYAWATG